MAANARRRYQDPKPIRVGRHWSIRIWNYDGPTRKQERIKVAPAETPLREVQKIVAGIMAPINAGLVPAVAVGAGTTFGGFVEQTYKPNFVGLLSKPVQGCYLSILKLHLMPEFGGSTFQDLQHVRLQGYFTNRATDARHPNGVEFPTLVKIRDTFSSVLRAAQRAGHIATNLLAGLKMPRNNAKARAKKVISPEQFHSLLNEIAEPYQTMVYVAAFSGLRISELLALRWRCVTGSGISVEERYYRGDTSQPKTKASAATVLLDEHVLARIHRLKTLTIEFRAGKAVRRYPAVKSCGENDLVFQSPLPAKPLPNGKIPDSPMSDGNVLRRHLKPAGRSIGLPFVNWLVLRRSCATWMIQSGVDVKSATAQMRHAKTSTTLGIYAQVVLAAQSRAAKQLTDFVNQSLSPNLVTNLSPNIAPNRVQIQ